MSIEGKYDRESSPENTMKILRERFPPTSTALRINVQYGRQRVIAASREDITVLSVSLEQLWSNKKELYCLDTKRESFWLTTVNLWGSLRLSQKRVLLQFQGQPIKSLDVRTWPDRTLSFISTTTGGGTGPAPLTSKLITLREMVWTTADISFVPEECVDCLTLTKSLHIL